MIKVQDILSLTEFHRHTKLHVARLHATGRPELLTVNGKATLVVQDAAAYQRMLERTALGDETGLKVKARKAGKQSPRAVGAKRE
jgi:hypothetical protein